MKSLIRIGILLNLACAFFANGAHAISKLEGFYEMQAWLQRVENQWQFGRFQGEGMPQHYLELKYLSYPYTDLESYFKVRTQSNFDEFLTSVPHEYKTPPYLSAEGHLKLRGKKYESFIFYRQNRSWIHDEPLLNLVDQDKLKNDNWGPQTSGVRADFWNVDFWKLHGLGGTFIYFDDGGTFDWTEDPDKPEQEKTFAMGTDALIFRLRKNSFGDRLEVGTSYLRKDWSNESISRDPRRSEFLSKSFNDVLAFDASFYPREIVPEGLTFGPLNLENASLITEYAVSRDPFHTETIDIRSKKNQFALSTEVREIYVSHLILHAWYNYFGENFRGYLSRRFDEDRNYNRKQYHVEGILLLPKKAITATVSYDFYKKIFIDEEGGNYRPTHNLYTELYIEFINGFKGKVAYNRWHGFDASGEVFDFFTYPNLFAELSVENRLAKVRVQARVRDFSTFREIFAYGYDMEFNATGKLKGYFRVLNVNEETEARSTVFAHVRYDIGWGTELFFEYGEPWHSQDLVNTENFVNEGSGQRIENRAKMFLKIYF